MKHDYKMSCLNDTDMSHYTFIRDSRSPHGAFDHERWWHMTQDRAVVWVCVVASIVVVIWGV